MIDRYKPGSDLTIMNTMYQFPRKSEDGKRLDDFLEIVYKDNNTGKKFHETIYKPEYTFYKAKDNVNINHNLLFIEKDKVEPVTVQYQHIEREIAKLTGNIDNYKDNIANNNRAENRKLHAIPNIFFSDTNIEDYYRFQFAKKFLNNINKINKSFFDIEVDIEHTMGDFVEMGECPINAISFLDEQHDKIVTFLLRDKSNPLIEEFENEIKSGEFGYKQIKEFATEAIGGWKQLARFKLDKTAFDIQFFDSEIELIRTFFLTVFQMDPDFVEGWNSSGFDLTYIIERIKVLGYIPEDIMTDPTWEEKVVKHYVDAKNLNEFAERGDYTNISGNPVWLDQLIQFASRRKSKIGSFKSFKLDDIGFDVAKVKKLDYHHITTNLALLPKLNYKTFVLYNIFDTVVAKCIEQKTQDLEYIFAKCLVNNTVYRKGHRQTVYLINRMAKEFDNLGFIIGNNANRWNEKPDKFLGALVGNPMNTSDFSKIKIDGVPIFVCDNLQDYDYKALYPSVMEEFNIAPNTQIGRIEINNKVYENENAYQNEKYSRGGEFIENMVTDNTIEFCKRWFHLAGFTEFIDDMQDFYNRYRTCYSSYGSYAEYSYHNSTLAQCPIYDIGERKSISPITFDRREIEVPIEFFRTMKESGVAL